MRYREHPGYRELLARARSRDSRAHVVCAATRDGQWSVKLTMQSTSVLVRTISLDLAIDGVMAAMEAVL